MDKTELNWTKIRETNITQKIYSRCNTPFVLQPTIQNDTTEDSSPVPRATESYCSGSIHARAGIDSAIYLEKMVESISQTLTSDENDGGYGFEGTYRYEYFDVLFNPEGCTWDARVEYGIAPSNPLYKNKRSLGAPFRIKLKCYKLVSDVSGGRFFKDYYRVDIQLHVDDMANEFKKDEGKIETVKNIFHRLIVLDILKALLRSEFPEFPEGSSGKSFFDLFALNAPLQSGSIATVCRATLRSTGEKFAVKCIPRKCLSPLDDVIVYKEVSILSCLQNPLICELKDFFQENEYYFIVLELMRGGDLLDRIGKKKAYTENDARLLCQKMLKAIKYCHGRNIAHCNLTPSNLLLVSMEDDSSIKLCDFGRASHVDGQNEIKCDFAKPYYLAPEVFQSKTYDERSDMWSVGVISYLLLCGNLPFTGSSYAAIVEAITKCELKFEQNVWNEISEEGKDFIKGLLVADPAKRKSANDSLSSLWFKADRSFLLRNNLNESSRILKTFNARMKLKCAAISVSIVNSLCKLTKA